MQKPGTKNALIVGIGSEIGEAIALHLRAQGWSVSGTYFNSSRSRHNLPAEVKVHCDFSVQDSIDKAAFELESSGLRFSLLLLASGTMLPIGNFSELDIDNWELGFTINFLGPARLIKRLLPRMVASGDNTPHCIFLVGGGINSTTVAFSSYTLAKIALVKFAEILDLENPEIIFSSVGPGWVRTKIHSESLKDPRTPKAIRAETLRRYREDDFVQMPSVMRFIDWVISQPKVAVGGRNFSVSTDRLEDFSTSTKLHRNPNLFKLRRRTQ